jgi:hypothetical protein
MCKSLSGHIVDELLAALISVLAIFYTIRLSKRSTGRLIEVGKVGKVFTGLEHCRIHEWREGGICVILQDSHGSFHGS